MKKHLLLFAMILLPLVASAHDIEVQNADGVTIYYNYINNGTELEVTFRGSYYDSHSGEYQGNVAIPEEVTYMNRTRKVTSIGEGAFRQCYGLTSVTIGNSVTSIGERAFYDCSRLTSVTIGNSVTSIGTGAFEYCSGLTSITIPNSVTSIKSGAFRSCYGLTSIMVEEGNSKYDSRDNCNAIIETGTNQLLFGCQNTKIPNSVTSIGGSAFSGCSRLTSITIPNSVTSIGTGAFEYCSGLTSITIPNSVTSIGTEAFRGCSGLTSVTIGNSVTSIGNAAFFGVDIPTVISLIENPFKIEGKKSGYRTFTQNTFNNATLYVPKGTIEKYKATDGWKDFLFIEEGTGGGDTPSTQKCEKPTISYENGKLTFSCATDGAVCQYSITDTDIKAGSGNEVQLGVTYNISVYATKSGYDNSETATATLCWIDAAPKTEGITDGVAQIAARPVLVKTDNGFITVEGADDRTNVSVYTTDGKQVGSAISQNNVATIATSIQPGSIAIVKIGEKAIKVVMK